MENSLRDLVNVLVLTLCSCFVGSVGQAAEKIIQEEKMSFERCLKVIVVSEEKLSISPEIFDFSENERTAIFTLLDGTLKITCNGNDGLVTVSTEMD